MHSSQTQTAAKKHTLCPGTLIRPINVPEADDSLINNILMFLVSSHSHHPSNTHFLWYSSVTKFLKKPVYLFGSCVGLVSQILVPLISKAL